MPKQYVTIEGKRVAVSDITSEEKPFPFSKNFHQQSGGEMGCDIEYYKRNIQQFERNQTLNRDPKNIAYCKSQIKELQQKILEKQTEISHRISMAKKHKLRYGKE